jgi:hypothetical protein
MRKTSTARSSEMEIAKISRSTGTPKSYTGWVRLLAKVPEREATLYGLYFVITPRYPD